MALKENDPAPLRVFDNQALDAAGYPSRWTRNRLMDEGKFPQPDFRIGNRPFWRTKTLDDWEDALAGSD